MDALLSVYHALPVEVWAFIVGTPAIVGVNNLIKKLFGVKSTLVIHSVTVTLSFLLSVLPDVVNNPKPLAYSSAFATAFFTAANFLYAVTKKVSPFFEAVKAYEAKKSTTAVATETAYGTGAAVITAETLPNTTVIPVTDPTVFEG